MDIGALVEAQQQQTQRSADLDRREREHGGLIPGDRDTEAKRRSVAGWGAYRPDVKRADFTESPDPRRVTVERLWIDCGYAVRRWCGKLSRNAAETVRTDALQLLLEWPKHGGGLRKDGTRAPILDLGGYAAQRRAERRRDAAPNPARAVLAWIDALDTLTHATPLRRDWLETVTRADDRRETRLTLQARYALRAAVKQAMGSPLVRQLTETESTEVATDALDIAALVEQQQRATDAATRLPDVAAPEVIRDALDIGLDAARAIVARAYPAATPRDLAESWRMAEATLKVALSRGAAEIRSRYPDPCELLDALDTAAPKWRAMTETGATLALLDYRDGIATEHQARDAVAEWTSCHVALSMEAHALLAAARRATQRSGRTHYGSERSERVASTVARLVRAETQRARHSAASAARGSHLSGRSTDPSGDTLRNVKRTQRELRAIVRPNGVYLVTRAA